MTDVIITEIRGNVAVITLNRPDALNAVNQELATGLGDALEAAENDASVRAIVVTGAGRGFSAGFDLKAFARGEGGEHPGHPEWGFGGFVRHSVDKPVIAAVNGFAFGGGAELVLAADLAVAGRSAKLGFPEVKRGLIAAAGGVIRLPRLIPRRFALELVLTGEPLSADRALELGLVNRVVDDGAVLDEAVALAAQIAQNAPLAVQASKRFIREADSFASDWDDEVWVEQDRTVQRVFASDDAAEGAKAFAEKRSPEWTGR